MTDEEFEIANTQFEAWQHAEGEWGLPQMRNGPQWQTRIW